VVGGLVELLIKDGVPPVALLTVILTEAVPPAFTGTVPLVDPIVNFSCVAVTVRLTGVVCDVFPLPLGVPVMVMVCAPAGSAILATVVIVSCTVTGVEPLSVTLVGLKLQSAPAGRPAVQLPGVELVGEPDEFVKLMVSLRPCTKVRVKVAMADCPADTDAGAKGLVVWSVKSDGVTLTVTAGDVEPALIPT
jgi:hypothetical protein